MKLVQEDRPFIIRIFCNFGVLQSSGSSYKYCIRYSIYIPKLSEFILGNVLVQVVLHRKYIISFSLDFTLQVHVLSSADIRPYLSVKRRGCRGENSIIYLMCDSCKINCILWLYFKCLC
jgi:hypothetical protein